MARAPLAAAIWVAMSTAAVAQEAAPAPATETTVGDKKDGDAVLQTITVTAQKRTENLQDVPISIQVLGTDQIEELHIADIDDVFKLSPSVSFQRQAEVPGSYVVYMRGVASGGDGNHSASQPSVGIYLDEQPVTTAQGSLDVHLYDIARVETLVGPQGTLYGVGNL
ncbi:MAG: Plug domain-containing protein [Rhodanobacteraceae bacterium]|nr:Plug domain-containing protein [Rhodanobacteraceae bacterium]